MRWLLDFGVQFGKESVSDQVQSVRAAAFDGFLEAENMKSDYGDSSDKLIEFQPPLLLFPTCFDLSWFLLLGSEC